MYWTSELKNDTRFVGIRDNNLFIANPKPAALDNVIADFKYQTGSPSAFFEIPFSYIKSVRLFKNHNKIELTCRGKAEEELIITDPAKRQEIFDALKNALPDMAYYEDAYSVIRAGKKPLIAGLVVMGLFIWSYMVAAGVDSGDVNDADDLRFQSVPYIIVILSNLGKTRLILLFGTLFAIATVAFIRKAKNPPVVRVLSR